LKCHWKSGDKRAGGNAFRPNKSKDSGLLIVRELQIWRR
jgi:hypothetical protein